MYPYEFLKLSLVASYCVSITQSIISNLTINYPKFYGKMINIEIYYAYELNIHCYIHSLFSGLAIMEHREFSYHGSNVIIMCRYRSNINYH